MSGSVYDFFHHQFFFPSFLPSFLCYSSVSPLPPSDLPFFATVHRPSSFSIPPFHLSSFIFHPPPTSLSHPPIQKKKLKLLVYVKLGNDFFERIGFDVVTVYGDRRRPFFNIGITTTNGNNRNDKDGDGARRRRGRGRGRYEFESRIES